MAGTKGTSLRPLTDRSEEELDFVLPSTDALLLSATLVDCILDSPHSGVDFFRITKIDVKFGVSRVTLSLYYFIIYYVT